MTLLRNRAVMIDLESMGQTPRAAITSIGAVLFDPHSDWIGDTLHIHVNLQNCVSRGLLMDAGTVMWWMSQPEEARMTLIKGQAESVPLYVALCQLSTFTPKDVDIWCNGASFDFAILRNAFDALDMDMAWNYWSERDLRTLKSIDPNLRITRTGTHHNALHDAIHQARLTQHILQFNGDTDA